jgi:hypothetical protein
MAVQERDVSALAMVAAVVLLQDGAPTEPDDVDHPFLVLHVALDGDDASSGLRKYSDGKGAGPLRTPQAALRRLREMKARDSKLRDHSIEILLSKGIWYLDAPLEVGPEDSGTPGHPLAIFGQDESLSGSDFRPVRSTVLSGGYRITGWRATKRDGHDVWVASAPEGDATHRAWTFRELFVNGERCPRARTPDHGCFAVAGVVAGDEARPWNEGVSALRIVPTDVARLVEGEPADVTLLSRWVESHCRVAALSPDRTTMRLLDKTVFKPDPGDLFNVESLSSLDQPGEWWLEESARLVWFVPRPGDDLERTVIVAPRLESLVHVFGSDDPARRVHDVLVSTIRFEGAEWWYPTPTDGTARASGSPQAAIDVPAAIQLHDAEHVRFRACEVTRCGTYGVAFGRGCQDDKVDHCWVHDLGGGGVKIGETSIPTGTAETSRIVVNSCELSDLGRVFHSAVGVWIGQSPDNRIEHCILRNLDYTGISIGWTWGYGPSHAGGNVVEGNEIGFIGARESGDGPLLSDMGGIYTLGTQDGTILRGNFIHDVAARTYGGWGIYFDEGSTHVEARDNVVLRTTHGGFHQHYGRENHVHHNLFAFGRDAALQRTRPEEHSSFTFDHNVVVVAASDAHELFAGDLRDGHFDFHENVYELADAAAARFAGGAFAAWQAAGRDRGSIVAPKDFVQSINIDGGPRIRQVCFAPNGSPIWTVLDPRTMAHNGISMVRDKD